MPKMEIQIEGTGGKYAHILRRYRRILEVPENIPLRLETLDHGMQSGAPSIAMVIEVPAVHEVVLAQTSVKLFQLCAAATLAKYGDQTQGAMAGKFDLGGKAELTFSRIEKCAGCGRDISGSCKFCPECGVRL